MKPNKHFKRALKRSRKHLSVKYRAVRQEDQGKTTYGDYFYQRGEPLTPLGKMAIYYPDGDLNPFFRARFHKFDI